MPKNPPDLSADVAALLPGVDARSAALLMRSARLGRLVDLHRSRSASIVGRLDASAQAVLAALLMLGPPYRQTPTFLRRHVLQTSGGMTKTLHRVEAEGFVTRVPDDRDGRVSYVQLTPLGVETASEVLSSSLTDWQAALERHDIDVDQALVTVSALVEVLEAMTGARLGRDLGV
jgi:DNA-binding MarR family transcriptional regulator